MSMGSPEYSRPFLSLGMGQKKKKLKIPFDLQWEEEQGMNALIQLQLTELLLSFSTPRVKLLESLSRPG